MLYSFKPAVEDDAPLNVSIAIGGGSGTGKTYSAMLLASGLAGKKPFAYADTENRRAIHYRGDFPSMHHLDFSPEVDGQMVGYPPERWIEVLDAAEGHGYPVVILDSFSHAWEGIGGVLEQHAQVVERMTAAAESRGRQVNADNFNMLAWAEVKPRYRRLIDRIIRAKCHTIICMRAKPVVQKYDKRAGGLVNMKETKLRRADLPWDIAADRDLIFEMTVAMLMTPEHPGVPVPLKCADQFKHLFQNGQPVGVGVGEEMAAWSLGDAENHKVMLDRARAEARKGRAAIDVFWKSLSRPERAIVNTIMDELKGLAARAEEVEDEDPFGTAPPSVSDEEANEIAARVREERDRLSEQAA